MKYINWLSVKKTFFDLKKHSGFFSLIQSSVVLFYLKNIFKFESITFLFNLNLNKIDIFLT